MKIQKVTCLLSMEPQLEPGSRPPLPSGGRPPLGCCHHSPVGYACANPPARLRLTLTRLSNPIQITPFTPTTPPERGSG